MLPFQTAWTTTEVSERGGLPRCTLTVLSLQAARGPDSQHARSPWLQAAFAALPEVLIDEGEMLANQAPRSLPVVTIAEIGELASLAWRERSLRSQDRVQGRVLQDHPQDEHDILELDGRHWEQPILLGRRQIGLFDR